MSRPSNRLDEARTLYARMMAAASGSADPRLERIFELVPREAFLPPGPGMSWSSIASWRRRAPTRPFSTRTRWWCSTGKKASTMASRSCTPAWIGAAAPGPGRTVTQVGAGGGYYTAILSMLVLPGGKIVAYEIDAALAKAARRNLAPFENVSVVHEDAVTARAAAVRHHLRQCRRRCAAAHNGSRR